MSDFIYRIIPVDPLFSLSPAGAEEGRALLRMHLPADEITVHISETPEFVDCGGELTAIRCPICGANLDFDWWGAAMDTACTDTRFTELSIVLPCCGNHSSLALLSYDWPCGFSCVRFDCRNPTDPSVLQTALSVLENCFGPPFRVIQAHL